MTSKPNGYRSMPASHIRGEVDFYLSGSAVGECIAQLCRQALREGEAAPAESEAAKGYKNVFVDISGDLYARFSLDDWVRGLRSLVGNGRLHLSADEPERLNELIALLRCGGVSVDEESV
jgi:hypothetical protein